MIRKKAKKEEKRDHFWDLPSALIDKVVGNEDLLIEILLRVPAKSLIKFKSVSKSWLKLISDPRFCYSHSYRAPKTVTRIYFNSFVPELKSISLQGYQTFPNLSSLRVGEGANKAHLEDICNGLILISGGYMQEPFTVSNLTTQKSILIPQLRSTSNDFLFACLAFDPAKSPNYKVIYVKHCRCPGLYEINIYSSETKSWQYVDFYVTHGYPSRNKVYWNGAIHWMYHNNIHAEFDIDKRKLIETPLPMNPKIFLAEEIHFFGECNGDLLLIQYKSRAVLGFRILEMKRETRHWVVKRSVNLSPILDIYPGMTHLEFEVLSVVKGLGESNLVLVLASGTVFLSYDLRTKAVKKLGNFEWKRLAMEQIISRELNLSSFCTHRFFESLFPI